jgi:hypothetical protein
MKKARSLMFAPKDLKVSPLRVSLVLVVTSSSLRIKNIDMKKIWKTLNAKFSITNKG